MNSGGGSKKDGDEKAGTSEWDLAHFVVQSGIFLRLRLAMSCTDAACGDTRLFVVVASLVVVCGLPLDSPPSQGKNPLRVYMIPHSHCDPLWRLDFIGYYRSDVRAILVSSPTPNRDSRC